MQNCSETGRFRAVTILENIIMTVGKIYHIIETMGTGNALRRY